VPICHFFVFEKLFLFQFNLWQSIYNFFAFVCSAFQTRAMRKHGRLAMGTFLNIYKRNIILSARTITAMASVSLCGISHNISLFQNYSTLPLYQFSLILARAITKPKLKK